MTIDVVELEQRARVRLRVEDVERCGRDLAGAQRLEQGVLVEQLAAGGVDEADAVAHRREGRRVDRAARLGGQRQMQGDEVGGGEHLVARLGPLDPELAEPLLRDERVVATTRISSPSARRATCWPIRPNPSTPSVLPASSRPP